MSGGYRKEDELCRPCPLIAIAALTLLPLAAVTWMVLIGYRRPLYSAAIDAVSGLDLGRNTTDLNPLFNVTVRIASRRYLQSDCVPASSVVEVSYAGATLAAGPVMQRLCARPRKTKEQRVVAWGFAVRVPGFALDGLVADARRGEQAFDVTVWMPWTLVSCRGIRAGDAAALGSPCAASDANTVITPPRPGVNNGGAS